MRLQQKPRGRRGLRLLLALPVMLVGMDHYFSSKGHDGWLQIIAEQRLTEIAAAQQKYRAASGGGSYGSFKQLVGAGLLDDAYDSDSPIIGRYRFTMRLEPGPSGRQPTFSVNADPHPAGNWLFGKAHYYLDSGAAIHRNNRWAATDSEPVCCR